MKTVKYVFMSEDEEDLLIDPVTHRKVIQSEEVSLDFYANITLAVDEAERFILDDNGYDGDAGVYKVTFEKMGMMEKPTTPKYKSIGSLEVSIESEE